LDWKGEVELIKDEDGEIEEVLVVNLELSVGLEFNSK
jgi:hypothetical protein